MPAADIPVVVTGVFAKYISDMAAEVTSLRGPLAGHVCMYTTSLSSTTSGSKGAAMVEQQCAVITARMAHQQSERRSEPLIREPAAVTLKAS